VGESGGERGRRMNMVEAMYTHLCKCKNATCGNVSGIRKGGIGESSGRGEFKYDIVNKF
jgi:hypothetical protein